MDTAQHRTRPRLRTLALVVLAAWGLAACGPAAEDEGDATLAARDEQIQRLRGQVDELEAELDRLDGEPPPTEEEPADRPAAARTGEGLVEQLHARVRAAPDGQTASDPAPTPWEPAEVPAGFGAQEASFDTAGELVTALAAQLAGEQLGAEAWEVAARVLFDQAEGGPDAETATGAVLLWGFLDDAVAGTDHRVALQRGADGWFVASAEERSRCARGVSGGLCV